MRTVCILGLVLVCGTGCAQPPLAELYEARQELAIALDYDADIYAPDEYGFALDSLREAESELERQDAAAVFSRNYGLALDQLELAIEQAILSQEVAATVREESYELAEQLIPQTQTALIAAEEEITRARRAQISFTQVQNLDADLAIASDYFRSGQTAFDNGDYVAAATQIEAAKLQADLIRGEAIRLIALSSQ